jgi:acetyl esterase
VIDPQARAIHDVITDGPSLDQRGVAGAREWAETMSAPPEPPDARLEIDDRTVAGVGVRVYRPAGESRSPVILFIHGGGWVLGDLDGAADHTCRQLALNANAGVVSVDYRLSPEAIYPAALEDCVNVLRETVENGAGAIGLTVDAVCVAGESSGGQLAAATCLRAAAAGIRVDVQLLICPVIDPTMDTASWREFGDEMLPVARQMSWMWDLYAGSSEVRANEPLVNLALDRDLATLPETLVLTAEYDPLRDEAESYGARLEGAGVRTEVRRLPGQVHAVFGMARAVDACNAALLETGTQIGTMLRDHANGGTAL